MGASEVGCDRRVSYPSVVSKRVFDVGFASLAILAFIPVYVAIALCIRLSTGGPVLFAHHRVGRNGATFPCWKFRTMVPDAELRLSELLSSNPQALREWESHRKISNDPRIIPGIGHFLRRTSLDELPQFFNILTGDMSVVGPRPVTDEEVVQYGSAAQHYLSVRPGVTGLWQSSGRNDLSFEERVAMDVEYVENWTFLGDLRLVWTTALQVIPCRGSG